MWFKQKPLPPSKPRFVESPCRSQCMLNADEICVGCGRSAVEIGEWGTADTDRQLAIRDAARERLARLRARS